MQCSASGRKQRLSPSRRTALVTHCACTIHVSTPVLHMDNCNVPFLCLLRDCTCHHLGRLNVLVILFLSFNRLLPSWQTFVIFSAERPASHQHARLTHFCVFTDKRSLHMHSLQLPSMKKIFFLDPDLTSAVAEEGRLLARAML